MGIIKKSGFYATIITYIGLGIGAVNTLIFFPKIFTPEQFGLIKVILDFGNIWLGFAPLATIGLILKYNPYYKHDNKSSDFFTWILLINLLGAVLFLILAYVFHDKVMTFFSVKSPLLATYLPYVFIFCILFQFLSIMESFSAANYKLILPAVLREIMNRLFQTLLAAFIFFKILSFSNVVLLYVFLPVVSLSILFYSLFTRGFVRINLKVSKITRTMYKEMIYFSSSIYAGNIFLMMANSLDSILISGLIGLDKAAVFILSNYIVTFISIPNRSISNIATPVLAESWKNNDIQNIKMIYEKSASTLFVTTYFMFILIWLNLDNAYTLLHLPDIYQNGKYIVLLLGITKVIDMGFGLNHEIMITSNYWRQNFYFQVILIMLFIPINYFAILKFGIIGPAVSNLILLLLYNLARSYFIWSKFKLSPFSVKLIYCFFIGVVCYLLAFAIPHLLHSSLITIFVKSAVFSCSYIYLIYKTKISLDINEYITKFLGYLKKLY